MTKFKFETVAAAVAPKLGNVIVDVQVQGFIKAEIEKALQAREVASKKVTFNKLVDAVAVNVVTGLEKQSAASRAIIFKKDGVTLGINASHVGGYELEIGERLLVSLVDASFINAHTVINTNVQVSPAFDTAINMIDAYVVEATKGRQMLACNYRVVDLTTDEWSAIILELFPKVNRQAKIDASRMAKYVKENPRVSTVTRDGKKYKATTDYLGNVVEEYIGEAEAQDIKTENRFNANMKALENFILNSESELDSKEVLEEAIKVAGEQMETKPFTNLLHDYMSPIVAEATANLVEKYAEQTPAVDETSMAEETIIPEEETEMKKEQPDVYVVEIDGKDVELISVSAYNKAITKLQEAMNEVADKYEVAIEAITDEKNEAQMMAVQLLDKVKELEAQVKSLADAKAPKTAKVPTQEVKDGKIVLRGHKVRKLNEDSVVAVNEELDVTGVIKARINTAAALDNTAQKMHASSPEKIANAAEKTKDGIQWTADKAKNGVDAIAKAANWTSEKTANGLTLMADVVAPDTKTVANHVIKKSVDGTTVTINGVEFRTNDKGQLI